MDQNVASFMIAASTAARIEAEFFCPSADLIRMLGDAALESSPDGIIACDRAGLIHYRNPAAEWQLTVGFPLQRSRGHIVAATGLDQDQLTKAIIAAADKGLGARICADQGTRGRFVVRVETDLLMRPLVIITVRDVGKHVSRVVEDATAAYGFTPAEAALAHSLLQGCSVEDHACEKGLRVSTVRTQLRGLMGKTETSRQGQMISLLLSDPRTLSRRG
ncbi:MAG: hypothetical protein JWO65_1631 [Sphingomonas bacterium]|nr:hypothetical protein [Sphingomonas bacterium]